MEIYYDCGEVFDCSSLCVDLYSSKADKATELAMRLIGAVENNPEYPDTLFISDDLMTNEEYVNLMKSYGLKVYSVLGNGHPNYTRIKEYYDLDEDL